MIVIATGKLLLQLLTTVKSVRKVDLVCYIFQTLKPDGDRGFHGNKL